MHNAGTAVDRFENDRDFDHNYSGSLFSPIMESASNGGHLDSQYLIQDRQDRVFPVLQFLSNREIRRVEAN